MSRRAASSSVQRPSRSCHTLSIASQCEALLEVRGHQTSRIDHDHGTGEVRGLLCMRCDNALGLFREDADLLKRAARYVTADAKHRSQRASWERLARERAYALRGVAA